MKENHPDFERLKPIVDEVIRRFGGRQKLSKKLPSMVNDAIDYVIDPVRTGRTKVSDLDSIEKTFIGLKVEHFLRDELNVPSGLRDLRVADEDVDVKNTVRSTWMIPPESFRSKDACLLIMTATDEGLCSFGAIIANPDYLNAPNRDGKRSVSKVGKQHIFWILQNGHLPFSRFKDLNMERFRELRMKRGGNHRVYLFCTENVGRVTHRQVFEALLHDQKDPMKRLRVNGGAGDKLNADGFIILSGAYNQVELKELGFQDLSADEFVCVKSNRN